MAKLRRGQDFEVAGLLTVITGDIRTRPPSSNSGGGDLYARHVRAGGSAGGFHIHDTTGTSYFDIMPDASPAPTNTIFTVGSGAIEAMRMASADGSSTISSLIADIDGAITFTDGKYGSGLALAVNSVSQAMVNVDFTPLAWQLVADTSGPLRVHFYKQPYSSYDAATYTDVSGSSTSTGGMPRIALGGGVKATSNNLSLWSSTAKINRGDIIRAVIDNNSGGVGWYALQIYGRHNVKKT